MIISLIGYRGVGKSTVARLLAERLGWSWDDADAALERQAGKSIQEIFATQGEGAFRDLEERVVAQLAALDRSVLALGGGAVLRDATRELVTRRGIVVWLQASVDTIWSRMQTDVTTTSRRPNLTVGGGFAEVQELLARREPIYRSCADLSVATDGKLPGQIADEIVAGLAEQHLLPAS